MPPARRRPRRARAADAWNCVPPDWNELISASTYQGYADFRRGAPLPLTSNAFYNVTWIPVSPL